MDTYGVRGISLTQALTTLRVLITLRFGVWLLLTFLILSSIEHQKIEYDTTIESQWIDNCVYCIVRLNYGNHQKV